MTALAVLTAGADSSIAWLLRAGIAKRGLVPQPLAEVEKRLQARNCRKRYLMAVSDNVETAQF